MKRPALSVLLALTLAGLVMAPAGTPKPVQRFRVGIVTEPAGVNVPIYRLMRDGLARAVRTLGVEGRVLTPSPKEGYLPSFSTLARQHYDLVIATAGSQGPDLARAAQRFPKTRFAWLDNPVENLPGRPGNVAGVVFAEQEVGYLVGYLAALMEKRRPGKDVISSVGGFKQYPPIQRFIAGYESGARGADPGITTLRAFTYDFLDRAKCRKAALAQIAEGSGVVFNVAGDCGFGALEAAKEKGVWGIGVDVDQSSLGPFILTSAVKRFDVAVFRVIAAAKEGSLDTGRTRVLRLRDVALGLGKISPKVPRSFVLWLERIRSRIVAGKIRIPTQIS